MKKLLFIPALLFTTGSLFLASCSNADTNNTMKAPVQNNTDTATQKTNKESGEKEENENEEKENEKDEKASIAKPISQVTSAAANATTTENM